MIWFILFIFIWIMFGVWGVYLACEPDIEIKYINFPMVIFMVIVPFIPIVAKIFLII